MMSNEEEFTLLDVFIFIRRYIFISLICACLFGVMGYFLSNPPQKMYRTTMDVTLKKLKSKGVWLTPHMLHSSFFKRIKNLGYYDVEFSNISSMKAKELTLSFTLKGRDKGALRESMVKVSKDLKAYCTNERNKPIETEYMTGRPRYFQAIIVAIFGAVFGYFASFLFISFRRWHREGLAL